MQSINNEMMQNNIFWTCEIVNKYRKIIDNIIRFFFNFNILYTFVIII